MRGEERGANLEERWRLLHALIFFLRWNCDGDANGCDSLDFTTGDVERFVNSSVVSLV